MREYKVIISPTASSDISGISRYLKHNLMHWHTDEFVAEIYKKIESLNYMPERAAPFSGFYMVHVKKYRIIYKIDKKKKRVIVARVMHSRMSLDKLA